MPYDVTPKGVIITGAAVRIGRALAIFLAKEGFDVVVHYHSSRVQAESLKQIIENVYNKKCLLIQADLQEDSSLFEIIGKSFDYIPYCNVLINNASMFYKKIFKQTEVVDFVANYNLHVRAPLFLSQKFAERCENQGKIINMIDSNITKRSSNYFTYMLSKKSLADLTCMLAEELVSKISVNAICPSFIEDDILNISDCSIIDNIEVKKILCKVHNLINNYTITGELCFI